MIPSTWLFVSPVTWPKASCALPPRFFAVPITRSSFMGVPRFVKYVLPPRKILGHPKGPLTTVADQAHKNSHANCNCERDKRAMLDFLGKAAQGIVAKLRCLAADFCRFVAHKIGAPAKPVGHAAQRRGNGLSDVVGSLRGTRGRSDTNTFQTLFHRPHAPFDFTDIGGHRAGISGLTKHHKPPLGDGRDSARERLSALLLPRVLVAPTG